MQKRDRNGVKIALCKKKKRLVSILGLGRFGAMSGLGTGYSSSSYDVVLTTRKLYTRFR